MKRKAGKKIKVIPAQFIIISQRFGIKMNEGIAIT